MAEYYPLIARAVDGIDESTPQTRGAVYERARSALMLQLRSLEPPLSEEDIERERLSLDDAIARVEADHRPMPAERISSEPLPAKPLSAKSLQAEPVRPPDFDDVDEPVPEDRPHHAPAAREETGPDPVHAYDRFHSDHEEHEGEFAEPVMPARPRVDSRAPVVHSPGQGRALVLGVILALVIGGIAVAAWFLRDNPSDLPAEPQVAEAPPAPASPDNGKLGERVGGGPPLPAPPAAQSRPDVGVAQRAVFYEENPANPQAPITQIGRVVWRLEAVSAGQGQPLETAVRAVVEVPDAGLTLNVLLRRNMDSTLPASHTVELSFTTRPGDPNRVVRDAGLLQFKNEESGRGAPIAGLPVPVRENLFLIGLSNLSSDVERNIDLLVRRNWIDLPIRLMSGQRAIISFEKGVVGEQVMNDAFRQWQ